MAKTLRAIYLFLIIILFCELIDEAQGSRLRCHHSANYSCKKYSSRRRRHHHHHNHNHQHHKDDLNESVGLQRSMRSKDHYGVDAFRPTAPGHSPGVGHSIKT